MVSAFLLWACGGAVHHGRSMWLRLVHLMVAWKQRKRRTGVPISSSEIHTYCPPSPGPYLFKIPHLPVMSQTELQAFNTGFLGDIPDTNYSIGLENDSRFLLPDFKHLAHHLTVQLLASSKMGIIIVSRMLLLKNENSHRSRWHCNFYVVLVLSKLLFLRQILIILLLRDSHQTN
jgi:hypothetical protein